VLFSNETSIIQASLTNLEFATVRTTVFFSSAHYNLDDHIAGISDGELPRVALAQKTVDLEIRRRECRYADTSTKYAGYLKCF
jgi:hypothetical protein